MSLRNIRWPFMIKRTHEDAMAEMDRYHMSVRESQRAEAYREAYAQATRDGRAQVHAFAVEVTSRLYQESHPNIFRNKALAAMQEIEGTFSPSLPRR